MKTFFFVTIVSIFLFSSTSNYARIIEVSITSYQFTPSNFTANVGDTVRWTYNDGSSGIPHTTTSTSVPGVALTWDSGTLSSQGETFMYPITEVGSYSYKCSFHGVSNNMVASFTVNDIGTFIAPFTSQKQKLNFPNPFSDKVVVSYNQPGTLMIFDILGNKVFQVEMDNTHHDAELNLSSLHPGVYFISLLNEGRIVETRKVIKEH